MFDVRNVTKICRESFGLGNMGHFARISVAFYVCGDTNLLKPTGYVMHQQVQHSTILNSAHTVYLCVLGGSKNRDYFPIQH